MPDPRRPARTQSPWPTNDRDVHFLAAAREPMLALDAVERGILVLAADHKTATVFVEEALGDAYRDGRFHDRKIEVLDGIMLYRAGYIDCFGRVTATGKHALLVWRAMPHDQAPSLEGQRLWDDRAAALFNGVTRALAFRTSL